MISCYATCNIYQPACFYPSGGIEMGSPKVLVSNNVIIQFLCQNFVHLVAWTCKDLNKPMILSRTVGNTNLQRVSEKRKSSQSWDTFKATNSDRCNDGASIECGNRKHHDHDKNERSGSATDRRHIIMPCHEIWCWTVWKFGVIFVFCFLLGQRGGSESPQKQILRSGAKVRKPGGICIWAQKLSPCMAILIISDNVFIHLLPAMSVLWEKGDAYVRTHLSGRIVIPYSPYSYY